MGGVIGRRRGSPLGPGIVEASMMIKLNKDTSSVRDRMMVKDYRTSWKAFIPRRPDDPADYYMNDEPEDENTEPMMTTETLATEWTKGMDLLDDSSIDSDDAELGLGS